MVTCLWRYAPQPMEARRCRPPKTPSTTLSPAPDRPVPSSPLGFPNPAATASCCWRPAAGHQSLDPHPAGLRQDLHRPSVNWKFESAPQPTLDNRRLYLPRGKTLGGTSSINGMVYIRGNHADYDEWRQRGCVGWDWDSVLPYFRKAQNQARGESEYPRHRRPAERFRSAGKVRAVRCRADGVRAGRHTSQPRLQRRAAGGLRLLPDHDVQPPPLEHGEGISRSGTVALKPDDPHRRPCHQGAARGWPRDRGGIYLRRGPACGIGSAGGHRVRRHVRVAAASAAVRAWAGGASAGDGYRRWCATCLLLDRTCTIISIPT